MAGIVFVTEWRRTEFLQVFDGAIDNTVLVAFLGRKVEQNNRYLGIYAVGCNLRTHHARAKYGDFADNEI